MLGLVAASWGVSWLMSLLPPGSLPRQQDVGFDLRIYLAATIATVIAGVVTGLVPALQIARPQLSAVFQGARGATEGPPARAPAACSWPAKWRWRSCCSSAPA